MTYNIKYTSYLSDILSEAEKRNSRRMRQTKIVARSWRSSPPDTRHESPIVSRCIRRITNGLSAITTTPTAIENQAILA